MNYTMGSVLPLAGVLAFCPINYPLTEGCPQEMGM